MLDDPPILCPADVQAKATADSIWSAVNLALKGRARFKEGMRDKLMVGIYGLLHARDEYWRREIARQVVAPSIGTLEVTDDPNP